MTPTLAPLEKWHSAQNIIKAWWYKPDLEGVLAAICTACSHYFGEEKAVWLQALGPSGSGKTELLIQALKSFPLTRVVGDITPKAFLSASKGPKNSLLPPTGGSSIWLVKDFTTLYSMNREDRKIVASRLREVWDGEIWRDTGQTFTLSWNGKVTVVAVGTPEIEEAWGALRGLGERFLTLRWRSAQTEEDRMLAMEAARQQLGHIAEYRGELDSIMTSLVDTRGWKEAPPIPRPIIRPLDFLSDIVATLRVHIERDYDPRRSPLSWGTPELPTRIAAGLYQIVRTHQTLLPGSLPEDSLALAKRVALDSIPMTRAAVLHWITLLNVKGEGVEFGNLLRESRIPKLTLQRTLEELVGIAVLDRDAVTEREWESNYAIYTPEFSRRMYEAGVQF